MTCSESGTFSVSRRPRGPGRSQARLDHLHALDFAVAEDLDRLAIEQEFDALFLAVLVVAARAGHVLLIAPVGAGDTLRALADRGAIAIHAGIAAAQHHDALAAQVDEALSPLPAIPARD